MREIKVAVLGAGLVAGPLAVASWAVPAGMGGLARQSQGGTRSGGEHGLGTTAIVLVLVALVLAWAFLRRRSRKPGGMPL